MTPRKEFVLGTRGSALALAQTHSVRDSLRAAHPGLDIRVEILRTRGDDRLDLSLQSTGPLDKGLFTKELEAALLAGRIDAAVHSLKDLPVEMPEGLHPTAILPREDPADLLIARQNTEISIIATSSPRRALQWLEKNPAHTTTEIRGNVPTRLRKIQESSNFQAAILALAGLKRLGLISKNGTLADSAETSGLEATPIPWMLAAPGQGAIAVQCRTGDDNASTLLAPLHCPNTAAEVSAERALLSLLGGGCHLALGARARILPAESPRLHLQAVFFSSAHPHPLRAEASGSPLDPASVAHSLFAKWNP